MAGNNRTVCNIVSYNLHGLNNGRSGLVELCENPDTLIIAIQEHLPPDKLHLLNDVHPDFAVVGISAICLIGWLGKCSMDDHMVGSAFLWRKSAVSISVGYLRLDLAEYCRFHLMRVMVRELMS